MTAKSIRWRLLVAVVALLVTGAWPALAGAATPSWDGNHWPRAANPVTIRVGDNLSGTWPEYLTEAEDDWSAHPELLIISPEKGSSSSPDCPFVRGTVQVCNGDYGDDTGWYGVARVQSVNHHITQGVVLLNDTFFNQLPYNTPEYRTLVVCQELAHTFGLGHQDVRRDNRNLGSCMDYTNSPQGGVVNGFTYGLNNEHPNQDDWDELMTLYQHLDPVESAAAASPIAGPLIEEPLPQEIKVPLDQQTGRILMLENPSTLIPGPVGAPIITTFTIVHTVSRQALEQAKSPSAATPPT